MQSNLRAPVVSTASAVPLLDDPLGRQAVELTCCWNDAVLRVDHFREWRDVTIGRSQDCDYLVPAQELTAERFSLLKRVGSELALQFTPSMAGMVEFEAGTVLNLVELRESGRALPVTEGHDAWRILLSPGSRARIRVGQLTFLVSFVTAPIRAVRGNGLRVTPQTALAFGAALAGWALLLTLFALAVPELDDFVVDSFPARDRIQVLPPRPDPPTVAPPQGKGTETPPPSNPSPVVSGPAPSQAPVDSSPVRTRTRTEIVEQVRTTGIFAVLGQDELTALLRPTQPVGTAIASATGPTVASAGDGGLGPLDVGLPSGPGGRSSVSMAPFQFPRTKPHGGPVTLEPIPDRPLTRIVDIRPPSVVGGLDPEIIRNVVKKQRDGVRACYERVLQGHRDLQGKVVVRFLISPTGTVIEAKILESQLDHAATEQCLLQQVLHWNFPAVSNGGLVEVKYPFIFRAI